MLMWHHTVKLLGPYHIICKKEDICWSNNNLLLKVTGELVSIKVNRYKCGYCGACVGVCPKGALELVETWVEVDESTCISCGICDRICPVGAIEVMK
jgi:NAD-dependent dihydropyrimidine dehydrogenase PreA subunit